MPSVAIPSHAPSVHRENCDQHHRFPKSLTKREIKCVNAKIEELDFEGSVYDWTFLPDELIESGLSNFAGAVRAGISAGVSPGAAPSSLTTNCTGLPSFAGASTRFRSRLWNRNTILPGTACNTALSTLIFHDPLNPQ